MKHDLTQFATCPVCLKTNEKNPSHFLIEVCVHALQVLEEDVSCVYHTQPIPLGDLIPEYYLFDFPSHLHLTRKMFEYNEAKPLHIDRQMVLHNGHINGKEVAIKMYCHIDSKSITFPLSCMRTEVDMLSSLNHPNIIKTFGFCLNPACVLIEKAPLGNLYQKLMNVDVKISRTVQFHISCQVASALRYLHQHKIIYHTLNTSSILLCSLDFNCDASIKLTNFERAAYLQSPSGLMGKTTFASYPALEMLRYSFREEYTEKVDVYAFGIFLHELVTRWQPYRGASYSTYSQTPKLSGVVTTEYSTLVKLMEECWQEEYMARPSADNLLLQLSQPSFQSYSASQVLHDYISVHGCCYVPSVQQIWVYGECKKTSLWSNGEISELEETQVFILNTENLTVQGNIELNERATAMCTVDNKVWIGTLEQTVHAYDTTTFQFTDQFHLDNSVTSIADSDSYVFIGQASGQLKYYSKLELQSGDCQPVVVEVGDKAIIAMVAIDDIVWLGCGNELVILSGVDRVVIERREQVCETNTSDQVTILTISHHSNTVWCLAHNSQCLTGWNVHTAEQKCTADLTEYLQCVELNYDPIFLRIVSIECVNDTVWLGLSCGVILILTDAERPEMITHFKAHREAVDCLLKIPHHGDKHDYPMILSGGYGEVSSLSSMASEQSCVVMLWHAFTANEFSTISNRHKKYIS